MRRLKADLLLSENIRALCSARNCDAKSLAFAVGHSQAWISKILTGDRRMSIADMDKIAAFFGLSASQLLQNGVSPLTERRRTVRRKGDRRTGADRRIGERRGSGLVPFANREYQGGRDPDEEDVA